MKRPIVSLFCNSYSLRLVGVGMLLFLLPFSSLSQQKLSPCLRPLLSGRQSVAANSPASIASTSLTAFVKCSAPIAFDSFGAQSLAEFGDIHILRFPISSLPALAAEERVVRIEASRSSTALNESMPSLLNIQPVYEAQGLPQAFTGRGVMLGIQDIGFDLTHPTFFSSDLDSHRVVALWDQLSLDTINSRLPVGQEYLGADALAYGHSRDATIVGHGSHTLATAAGSGFEGRYRGISWESDLCLVANAVSNNAAIIDEADLWKYTSATDALGFKYIFDQAEALGMPCVINFSEGSRQDFYGDDILYYEVLDRLLGPGRIIVASAGNNNLSPSYIHKPRGRERAGSFLEKWSGDLSFSAVSADDFTTRIVVHSSKNDTIAISLSALCQKPDSLHNVLIGNGGHDYEIQMRAYPSAYTDGRTVVECAISPGPRLGMYGPYFSFEVLGSEADVEVYKGNGNFVSKPADRTLCDAECSHDVVSPGSAPRVICVGSTAYATGWTSHSGKWIENDEGSGGLRASYSSVGPTVDGRRKPDVMAPGNNIISAYSSFLLEAEGQQEETVALFPFRGRTYEWHADTGTSMATPAVAGVIALWLQAKPDLSPEDVMEVLAATCSHPAPSLPYPNNEYGYGQIDAYRGLLHILNLDGIEGVSLQHPEEVQFRVEERGVKVLFPAPLAADGDVKVFSASGQLQKSVALATGQASFFIPLAPRALYLLQIDAGGKKGSTLVRL